RTSAALQQQKDAEEYLAADLASPISPDMPSHERRRCCSSAATGHLPARRSRSLKELRPRRFAPRTQFLQGPVTGVTHVPGQKCNPCAGLHPASTCRSEAGEAPGCHAAAATVFLLRRLDAG